MKITKVEEKTLSELRSYPFSYLLKISSKNITFNLEKNNKNDIKIKILIELENKFLYIIEV